MKETRDNEDYIVWAMDGARKVMAAINAIRRDQRCGFWKATALYVSLEACQTRIAAHRTQEYMRIVGEHQDEAMDHLFRDADEPWKSDE